MYAIRIEYQAAGSHRRTDSLYREKEQEIVPGSMSFRELVFTALPFLYLVVGIGSMIRKKRGKRSSNETQKD